MICVRGELEFYLLLASAHKLHTSSTAAVQHQGQNLGSEGKRPTPWIKLFRLN